MASINQIEELLRAAAAIADKTRQANVLAQQANVLAQQANVLAQQANVLTQEADGLAANFVLGLRAMGADQVFIII
jgi:hypothetical protein